MRLVVLSSLLLLTACSLTGDALVVVTVSSSAGVNGILAFHVTATANGHSKDFVITPTGGTFAIPPSKTFGVQVPSAYAGPFSLSLDALDGNSKVLASGTDATSTSAGKEATLDIQLGPPVADGGGLDANLDGAADANPNADLTCMPMTCAAAGYGCGTLDSCGQMIDCGPCTLTSAHPSIANTGDTITLEGRFTPSMMVQFPGGAMIAPTLLGPNRATVVVPATATAGSLSIVVTGSVPFLKQPFRRATFKLTLGDFRQSYEQADYARPMPQLNTPRNMGDATMLLGETLMVLGGTPNGGGPSPSPIAAIEEADVASDGTVGTFNIQNQAGRALVTPRANFVTFNASGSAAYVIGGTDGNTAIYSSIEVGSSNGDGSGLNAFTTASVSLTMPRMYATGAVIGSYLYIIGGANSIGAGPSFTSTTSLERSLIGSDGSLGPFQAVTSQLMTPRIGAAAFVARGKLYVIGGTPDGRNFLTSIEEAPINGDGSLGNFTVSAIALTLDRALPGVWEMGGTLYLLGGASTNLGTSANANPVTSIEFAPVGPGDGNLGAFGPHPSVLAEKRACQPLLIGNYLYFFNGGSGDGIAERASIVDGNARFSSFSASAMSLSTPRWGMAPAVVGKYMFLFGGSTFNGTNGGTGGGPLTAVVRATIADDGTLGAFANASLPPLTTQRVGATAAVFGRVIDVCGGQSSSATRLFDCEQFQINYDGSATRSAGPMLATAREHFQLAAVGNTLYAIGGDNFTTYDSVPLNINGPSSFTFVSNTIGFADTSPQKMAIVTGNFGYLIGGDSPSSVVQQGQFPLVVGATYAAVGAIPGPLYDATVLSTGSAAFLIGGLGTVGVDLGSSIPATSNILAAGVTNKGGGQVVLGPFTNAGMMTAARQQATGVIIGNNVYVIAGADGTGGSFNPLGSIEQATIQ